MLAELPKSERMVAYRLLARGPATQGELVSRTGLSRPTVIGALKDLAVAGLVAEAGEKGTAAEGRRAQLYQLTPAAGLSVGVEIGRQHVTATVVDAGHQRIYQEEEPLKARAEAYPTEVLEQSTQVAARAAAHARAFGEVLGIGFGLPFPVTREGKLASRTFRPPWADIDPVRELSGRLDGTRLYVGNRVDLGALGEYVFGHGSARRDLTYVKLGTGIGAGIVAGGRLYTGASGTAGELGHISIDYRGPLCPCGNRGCVEVYAGGDALLEEARLARREIQTIRGLVSEAMAGDVVCQRIIAEAGIKAGIVLGALVSLTSPGLIVLGGSLSAAGEILTRPLRQALDQASFAAQSEAVTIELGALGKTASASGAAALVFERLTRR